MYSLLWMWHQSHCCHSEPPVSPGSECQGLSVISILKVRFSIAHVHTVFHCHCFVDKRPDLQDQWSTEFNSISSYLLNYWLFSPHNCFWILKIKAIPFQVSLYSQDHDQALAKCWCCCGCQPEREEQARKPGDHCQVPKPCFSKSSHQGSPPHQPGKHGLDNIVKLKFLISGPNIRVRNYSKIWTSFIS